MLNPLPTVLIADDEPNICRIAKLIIPESEFNVITAENGIDAYEKALQHSPDIIFSDILMPKCDGFEFCQKIKQNESTGSIPFVFLTGVDEKQCQSRMKDVKADDFLSKPFSSKIMIEKIKSYVKPVVPIDNHSVQVIQKDTDSIQFGNEDLDLVFESPILPQSFILLNRHFVNDKLAISREFIMDGIKKQQQSLLLSFDMSIAQFNNACPLNVTEQSFLTFLDASNWTQINSKPWRNIDYIYDTLFEYCSKKSFQRIIIDSFSHGFAFWSLKDMLKLIDLCRTLPNFENQCILWNVHQHPSVENIIYHLQHAMDIGIQVIADNHKIKPVATFSKWQPILKQTPTETPVIT